MIKAVQTSIPQADGTERNVRIPSFLYRVALVVWLPLILPY